MQRARAERFAVFAFISPTVKHKSGNEKNWKMLTGVTQLRTLRRPGGPGCRARGDAWTWTRAEKDPRGWAVRRAGGCTPERKRASDCRATGRRTTASDSPAAAAARQSRNPKQSADRQPNGEARQFRVPR